MCDGMVACETPVWGTRSHTLVAVALQLFLFLSTTPTAQATVCRPPSEPENGGYMCHPTPCPKLIEGTVIEYFCDEGYTLKGYRYHTCKNGDWDSQSATPIICHLGQGKEERSPLGMPALSIVASTASSVALILLLVVLFVLLQPKLKSFHHSRLQTG
ncbi:hypothetical protein NFI96_005259 [Prochilodus magdalenae]|nr:hypothetical protein NFI96_005259 [Prochilodus magdalenae]